MDIKDKVIRIASTIEHNDGSKGFNYFVDLMEIYSNDPDFSQVKEKVDNLIILMNKLEDDNKLSDFYSMDFETEIWNLI